MDVKPECFQLLHKLWKESGRYKKMQRAICRHDKKIIIKLKIIKQTPGKQDPLGKREGFRVVKFTSTNNLSYFYDDRPLVVRLRQKVRVKEMFTPSDR